MLINVQLFVTEIGSACNLASEHKACPVNSRTRTGAALTNDKAVALICEAYQQHRFRGHVAFHWYNEPMLQVERLFSIGAEVKSAVPNARFLLWTNGTYQPADERMKMFDAVKCTEYFKRPDLAGYYRHYSPCVDVIHWNFDGRIKDWRENRQTPFRCLRPDIEVIIDNYGEMRLCCQDWQGDVPIGNVWQDSLTELLKRRQSIVATIQRQMGTSTPERCRRCAHKIRQPSRIVK